MKRQRIAVSFASMIGLAGGCALNQSGNVSSTKDGDTSRPADRGSPIEMLRATCGDGALTDAGLATIKRQPYLQQVTSTSAQIGWVSSAPDGAMVSLTTADGGELSSANAFVETQAARAAGENQMWTNLENLEPDTVYCYTVSDGTQALAAPTGFRTAPAADSTEPVRFLAFGDSGGGGSDQYALLDQMFTVPFDLIVHTGDVAYDDGTIGQFEENVFGVYNELFKNRPFFPSAGNHDYNTMQGAPFRDVFSLPGTEKWYSYDWGQIHFAALDTEADYATQAAWLDQDLAGTTLPWKIVYMHKPPYSSGEHGSDMALRNLLAPIFKMHGVQLVLAGHDHNYERMLPQDGTNYVVTGGGGRGTRTVGSSSFTAHSNEVIHFVYGEVAGDELVLHAIDGTGREFDALVVQR